MLVLVVVLNMPIFVFISVVVVVLVVVLNMPIFVFISVVVVVLVVVLNMPIFVFISVDGSGCAGCGSKCTDLRFHFCQMSLVTLHYGALNSKEGTRTRKFICF